MNKGTKKPYTSNVTTPASYGTEPSGSTVAGGEVVNPRCDGCGKPGQWPLHHDGLSHLCSTCIAGLEKGPKLPSKPDFDDLELTAIAFVMANFPASVPPGLVDPMRSVLSKLSNYHKERES